LNKVIIVTHNFYPESVGGASRIYEMARLLKQSYEVTIVCPPPTYPFTKYEKAKYILHKENLDDFKVFRIWTYQPSKQTISFLQRFLYYLIFPILSSVFLLSELHRTSFVIVTTPPSSLLFTTLIVRLFKKKIILDVRDIWIDAAISLGYVNEKNILAKIVKKFENYCWKKSDLIITNSMIILDTIKRTLDNSNLSKVKYFPFNVDLQIFKRNAVKREKEIVYIGNFGVAQSIETLIKAIQIVLTNIPDLKVHLYGGGDREHHLKRLVKELKLEHVFKFNSPIPRKEIPSILSKALLGIVPLADSEALHYAIPTKTFEYFACELPVLGYGSSVELERVIKESGGGLYVKGNNHEEIAHAIIRILNDQNMMDDFSKNGRKFVEHDTGFPILTMVD